jgi:hypothetical protein
MWANPKSDRVLTDSRGVKLEEGLRVAYNLSGSIALGVIKKIHKNKWKQDSGTKNSRTGEMPWRLEFELHVLGEDNKISKIKNPNSFLII